MIKFAADAFIFQGDLLHLENGNEPVEVPFGFAILHQNISTLERNLRLWFRDNWLRLVFTEPVMVTYLTAWSNSI